MKSAPHGRHVNADREGMAGNVTGLSPERIVMGECPAAGRDKARMSVDDGMLVVRLDQRLDGCCVIGNVMPGQPSPKGQICKRVVGDCSQRCKIAPCGVDGPLNAGATHCLIQNDWIRVAAEGGHGCGIQEIRRTTGCWLIIDLPPLFPHHSIAGYGSESTGTLQTLKSSKVIVVCSLALDRTMRPKDPSVRAALRTLKTSRPLM